VKVLLAQYIFAIIDVVKWMIKFSRIYIPRIWARSAEVVVAGEIFKKGLNSCRGGESSSSGPSNKWVKTNLKSSEFSSLLIFALVLALIWRPEAPERDGLLICRSVFSQGWIHFLSGFFLHNLKAARRNTIRTGNCSHVLVPLHSTTLRDTGQVRKLHFSQLSSIDAF
jgi:hypothetical protein